MIFMISSWNVKREQQVKFLSKDPTKSLEQKTPMNMLYTKILYIISPKRQLKCKSNSEEAVMAAYWYLGPSLLPGWRVYAGTGSDRKVSWTGEEDL